MWDDDAVLGVIFLLGIALVTVSAGIFWGWGGFTMAVGCVLLFITFIKCAQ
jgi:hypothetical protein